MSTSNDKCSVLLEIKKGLEKIAGEFNIADLEIEFHRLDLKEKKISPNLNFKVFNFDALVEKYCSGKGLHCDRYSSADGLHFDVENCQIVFIEIKSIDKFTVSDNKVLFHQLPFDKKSEAFEAFIKKNLEGETQSKKNKDKHPFDSKILDSYLMLTALVGESIGREGLKFMLDNDKSKAGKKPIKFFGYIPGIDIREYTILSNAVKPILEAYKQSSCSRFRSLDDFILLSDWGIETLFKLPNHSQKINPET